MVKKKFYVGKPEVVEGIDPLRWGKDSLKEAIAHATKIIESGQRDEAYVVKVVRVVRRKPQPIVVETV